MTTDLCPSCGKGKVTATFQVFVTFPLGDERIEPDTDGFVSATCDNEGCADALVEEAGDGRLRRAYLTRDYERAQDDDLEAAWMAVVGRIVEEAT